MIYSSRLERERGGGEEGGRDGGRDGETDRQSDRQRYREKVVHCAKAISGLCGPN